MTKQKLHTTLCFESIKPSVTNSLFKENGILRFDITDSKGKEYSLSLSHEQAEFLTKTINDETAYIQRIS